MIDVPRETAERLTALEALVIAENARQNLVSAATIPEIRSRHINDSLQLLAHTRAGTLIDIGSGAGFPGLVLACCREEPTHLIEPRRRRAEFLVDAADRLGLQNRVFVHQAKAECVNLPPAATITARAVANLSALFTMAAHLVDENTRWVLPKGKSAAIELVEAEQTWQGAFRLIPSETDPAAAIVIAENVRRRRTR